MKKNVIFISISLGLIILLGIGVSYSMWNISVSQDTTNMAESKCFDLSITNKENNISLDNAYPISNDKGKSLTPFTFTVTNTCDITAQYNINLEVLNTSTLSSNFIDVMLENNDIKEINLLSNFDNTDKVNTNSIESRKLTTGILKSRESKDYSLRLWIDYNTTLEDLNNEIKSFKSKIVVVGKPINFNYAGDMVFNFDYTGSEQTFTAPVSGTYRLETWGAQGGSAYEYSGGYGAYSVGEISLNKGEVICVIVGGAGQGTNSHTYLSGGYNGGGSANPTSDYNEITASGGGATHIATTNRGTLDKYASYQNELLIVAGGGGGSAGNKKVMYVTGGAGGGFTGNDGGHYTENLNKVRIDAIGYGATQVAGGKYYLQSNSGSGGIGMGSFGKGANGNYVGAGGGYYGGGLSHSSAGGGSGYIGNSLLTNKVMYCYNCEESDEESTKTISTTCNEETPTSYCAKKGNGYARITLVSID